MSNHPFSPGATVELSVSTSSDNVALGLPLSNQVHLVVGPGTGNAHIHIKFGDSAVTVADGGGLRMLVSTSIILTVPMGATHIAAIANAGTNTLTITSGHGD
jgi:hypothetical protein